MIWIHSLIIECLVWTLSWALSWELDENSFVCYPWEQCFEDRNSVNSLQIETEFQLFSVIHCIHWYKPYIPYNTYIACANSGCWAELCIHCIHSIDWQCFECLPALRVHCTLRSSTSGPLIGCPTVYYFLWTNFCCLSLPTNLLDSTYYVIILQVKVIGSQSHRTLPNAYSYHCLLYFEIK